MLAIPHLGGRSSDEPPPPDVIVIGDGAAADAISHRLDHQGRPVTRLAGTPAAAGGAAALDRLDREPEAITDTTIIVVATDSDGRNLLTAQLLRTRFDLDRVIVLANDPDRVQLFLEAGHEPICAATAVGDAIAGSL